MSGKLIEQNDPGAASFGLQTNKTIVALSGTAVTAGGATKAGLQFGSTTGPAVYFGSGAPTITAPQGSVYLNTTGSSTSTRMYINTTGSTTWTAVTTAA